MNLFSFLYLCRQYLHHLHSTQEQSCGREKECTKKKVEKMMRKGLLLFLLLILLMPLHAQYGSLTDKAQVSLLTVAPSEDEVYTIYGHSAIRIQDPTQKFDIVFNYGIFDFSKPHFIYHFTKGETDYQLGINRFNDFIIEYELRGSKVTEQILNLDSIEKNNLWKALMINALPENRVYRYNFFFDNCATRPEIMIERCTGNRIHYRNSYSPESFRKVINECSRHKSWLTFGCDLVLGAPTDRNMTAHEKNFLPSFLEKAFAEAIVTNHDGAEKKLVASTHTLIQGVANDTPMKTELLTPLFCCWALFFFVALLTLWEILRKTYWRIIDCLLFSIAGLSGCIIFFLCFISTHPCVWPNWQIVWLHPLHLMAVLLFTIKKYRNAAYYYHFINFAVLLLMLIGWHFIPQHLNTAFIPLVMSLCLRSGYGIYRKLWNIE